MIVLNFLGLLSSLFMIGVPFFLIREVDSFKIQDHAISHLGGVEKTARRFNFFLLLVGLLEYLFFLRLLFYFGVDNFRMTTPILSVTLVSTLFSAVFSSRKYPTIHYFAAVSTFCSAGIGGLTFSIEFARLTQNSVLSLVGIVVSVLLLSSLTLGIQKLSISAFNEFLFVLILSAWNFMYTLALFQVW